MTQPHETFVFVFGSNRAGLHGAGAAAFAERRRGAVRGVGEGMTGNAYALPTKDHNIRTLPLPEIKKHVQTFLAYAEKNSTVGFQVTRVGCGLAGYSDEDIAPLFVTAPSNCWFDEAWGPYLPSDTNYWGHK